ncbi:hypothetical protein AGR2A_Lc30117 [Agrobacterium genomosp. 2 str. CFBP 5494]|uniref:Uncharacterized protein n=1 Tax=Agrobacterium genomosp. 2 str. CFBP 5494 TaxID=1183436 RepID=A0A9W5F451_9HYPH|nr:hypothetical protein AGR2A_Lc30117 [Agrobacterium genomosp. 2 str. CFBP 5494]
MHRTHPDELSLAVRRGEIGDWWRLQNKLAVRGNVVVGVKPGDRLVAIGIDITSLFIEAFVMNMHMNHFAQHQRAAGVIDQSLHPALEGAGRLRGITRIDLATGHGSKLGHRHLVNFIVEAETADQHLLRKRHIDHIDDELASAADIHHRILFLAAHLRLNAEDHDGRIMRKDVEEAHRRCIVMASFRAGRHECDRPRTDKIRQKAVAALGLKRAEIEFHDRHPNLVYNYLSYC